MRWLRTLKRKNGSSTCKPITNNKTIIQKHLIMKKYFLFAASALAIAGCSSDDFLGNDSSNGLNTANAVIKLGGSTTRTSRATTVLNIQLIARTTRNQIRLVGSMWV